VRSQAGSRISVLTDNGGAGEATDPSAASNASTQPNPSIGGGGKWLKKRKLPGKRSPVRKTGVMKPRVTWGGETGETGTLTAKRERKSALPLYCLSN